MTTFTSNLAPEEYLYLANLAVCDEFFDDRLCRRELARMMWVETWRGVASEFPPLMTHRSNDETVYYWLKGTEQIAKVQITSDLSRSPDDEAALAAFFYGIKTS